MVTHHQRMVTNHPKSNRRKCTTYRLGIWRIDLIKKLRPGDSCHGWSATIPLMVTQHPQDGHLSVLSWSPSIQYHLPKYCRQASQGWSATIPNMVTQDYWNLIKLNKEFDTSAAQLVQCYKWELFKIYPLSCIETKRLEYQVKNKITRSVVYKLMREAFTQI